jgi:hypothetical protein
MKFSIGDMVVEKETLKAHTSYNVSKVVGFLDGALLLEHYGFAFDGEVHPEDYKSEPGTRGWRKEIQRYQEEELCTPEAAVKELHRLGAIKDKLNEEFEGVRESIQAKLDAAAVLVQEAADIAKPFNKELDDLSREECRKLYEAQEKNGWRASHVRC